MLHNQDVDISRNLVERMLGHIIMTRINVTRSKNITILVNVPWLYTKGGGSFPTFAERSSECSSKFLLHILWSYNRGLNHAPPVTLAVTAA